MGAARVRWLAVVLAFGASACGGDDGDRPPADGGLDAADDAAQDSPSDAWEPIADAGSDTAVLTCSAGLPCGGDRACPEGECVDIVDGGYCSPVAFRELGVDPLACDPDSEVDACGDCATCVDVLGWTMCFRDCEPSMVMQTCPVASQTCDYLLHICWPDGCTSDERCRRYLDPAGTWVTATRSDIHCNRTTGRCEHGGTPGASAGDACTVDWDCELDGRCIVGWPGGYCSKNGCDVEGRSCVGTLDVCYSGAYAGSVCMQGCVTGAEVEEDRLGPGGHGSGCRADYRCLWDRNAVFGAPTNGICVPGNYNDVTDPNVGAACSDDAQCYSPYGAGLCLVGGAWSPGYCSILDCDAPGLPADLCGPSAVCVSFFDDVTTCLQTCMSAADCSARYGCVDLDMDPATPRTCLPTCTADADCREGETCDPTARRCG